MSERLNIFEWSRSSMLVLSWPLGAGGASCRGCLTRSNADGEHTVLLVLHDVHEIQLIPRSSSLTINASSEGKADVLWTTSPEACVPVVAFFLVCCVAPGKSHPLSGYQFLHVQNERLSIPL